MIAIRADANEHIAMGHVMRCISIAQQLKAAGHEVIFILSENYVEELLHDKGFESICLDNSYADKESELEVIVDIIKSRGIDRLLLDSYQVTAGYMEELRKHTKLFYIDDLNEFRYPADVVINYTFMTEASQYEGMGYDDSTQFCLGSHYVPLRAEFAGEPIEIRENVERIFITTGGTDGYDMLLGVLKAMDNDSSLAGVEKCVVAGRFYGNIEELRVFAADRAQISVYQNVSDIYSLMKECDIAISAGGTTLAELGACGIPTICFSMADNQDISTKRYAEAGVMIFAGNVCSARESVLNKIVEQTGRLAADYEARKALSDNVRTHFDGKGAERIAAKIMAE